MTTYPKISIVTPSFNQGNYLEETILSVLNQNYPNLEYIIIDGGSTDNSIDIIKKYESKLSYWISEKDNGMYDAIEKGFAKSTGEIMAWINSDDIYVNGAFEIVSDIFKHYDAINWITGLEAHINEQSRVINCKSIKSWSKYSYALGDYKFIQQETTFWRRSLWELTGSELSKKYQYAADAELWSRFFTKTQLYSVNALLGLFRLRSEKQISLVKNDEYIKECELITHDYLPLNEIKKIQKLARLSKAPIVWRLFQSSYQQALDYPTLIQFDRKSQTFHV